MDVQILLPANRRIRVYTVFLSGNVRSGRESTVIELCRKRYAGHRVIWTESRGVRARFIAEPPPGTSWADFDRSLLPLLAAEYGEVIRNVDYYKSIEPPEDG